MSKNYWRTTQLKVPPRQVYALVCALEGAFAQPGTSDYQALQECSDRGWVELRSGDSRLTPAGRHLATACVALVHRRIENES